MLLVAAVALTATAVAYHGVFEPSGSAFMRHAQAQLRARHKPDTIHHVWVDIERIAPAMKLAVIAAEDQRFFEHYGIDWEAVQDAMERNKRSKRLRGASTITQQVAKNLYLWPARSWLRKAVEAWFTVLIETFWSKQRILEVYLNVAQFDDDVFGVEAAARRFFHKPAARLNSYEAALLAAALPSPTRLRIEAPSAYLRHRQLIILAHMRRLGPEALRPLDE